jgi:hypothetical protein
MGMHWSIKTLSEERVIEWLRRQALHRQLVTMILQRMEGMEG